MVEKTLRAMRHGGVYDHVGFGIHRYSTDNVWLVPHEIQLLQMSIIDQGIGKSSEDIIVDTKIAIKPKLSKF